MNDDNSSGTSIYKLCIIVYAEFSLVDYTHMYCIIVQHYPVIHSVAPSHTLSLSTLYNGMLKIGFPPWDLSWDNGMHKQQCHTLRFDEPKKLKMGLEIVNFPIKNGGSFNHYANVYQMVFRCLWNQAKTNLKMTFFTWEVDHKTLDFGELYCRRNP